MFEDLWTEAAAVDAADADRWLRDHLGATNPFYRFALKSVDKASTGL